MKGRRSKQTIIERCFAQAMDTIIRSQKAKMRITNSKSQIKLNFNRPFDKTALEKKKGTRFSSSPLNLVRLAGIEPTTPWFVAKYSIQLSYSREKQNYSTGVLI